MSESPAIESGQIRVEVVHALPHEAVRVALSLPQGSSAGDAFEASGLRQRLPEWGMDSADLGIFGHPCGPERLLRDGDRVEIYRPLQVDPMDARRRRAAKGS